MAHQPPAVLTLYRLSPLSLAPALTLYGQRSMTIVLLAFEGVQLPPKQGCLEKLCCYHRDTYSFLALPLCLTDRPAQAL